MWAIVRQHLIWKLALVLLLTVGVGFTVPAILNLRQQIETMEAMQAQAASAVARGLSAGVRTSMLAGNGDTAREMVKHAREHLGAVRIHIYAPSGEEVFAPDGPPPAREQLPAHVRQALDEKKPVELPEGGTAIPIANDSRCQLCHGQEPVRGVLTLKTSPAKDGPDLYATTTKVVSAGFVQLMTADHTEQLEAYFEDLKAAPGIAKVAVFDADADFSLGDKELHVPRAELEAALESKQARAYKPAVAAVAPKRGPGKARRAAAVPPSGEIRLLPLEAEQRCRHCHEDEQAMRGVVAVEYEAAVPKDETLLAGVITEALEQVMLSGLGRLIARFLDDVAKTGALSRLSVHDHEGRLFKDAFLAPEPSEPVRRALAAGNTVALSSGDVGNEHYTFVEPLKNEADCKQCHGSDHELRGAIEVVLDTSEAARGRVRLAQLGAVFGLLTVFAVLGLLVLGLRLLVVRPVSEIGDIADRVAQGELSMLVNVKTQDEIGRLAGRINHMVIELRKKLALSKFVSEATVKSIDKLEGKIGRGGERRRCTVLFSDVRGFTAFSEQRQPEEVVDALNRYLHAQAQVVKRHGGDIDKFVGDELMAHFTGTDMEASAVAAAVEMIEAVEKLNAALPPDYAKLAIGVGVNAGDVVFGAMGAEDRMDFTVIGDAVNLGARLCSAAKPGQVLVSGFARQAFQEVSGVSLEPLEPISVKGKREPIPIFEAKRKR